MQDQTASSVPIPWEERPLENRDILWRFSANPIVPARAIPCANSIFNSAVVPFGDGYSGVFRVDDRRRHMRIHAARSSDGIHWQINHDPIQFECEDDDIGHFVFGYDPRLCRLDGRYYLSWCNGYHGPTVGLAWTDDFETFHQMENAFLPFNRNGVLFPRKIRGHYAILSRPSDNGHTPFGDIFYSESPDLCFWGRHRHVMAPTGLGWDRTKLGAGPSPIETEQGWLLIYHGVLNSCSGFVYSMGAALLDRDEPWRVIARGQEYLMSPEESYERTGDVPNVVFPCAALVADDGDRLALYYGAADTVLGLAFGRISEIVDFVLATNYL